MTRAHATADGLVLTGEQRHALLQLRDAHTTACALRRPPEEFALQLQLSGSQWTGQTTLRWLLHGGLAHHLYETTKTGQQQRTFRHVAHGRFRASSCFLISRAGLALSRQLMAPRPDAGADREASVHPCYDSGRRALLVEGVTIKIFRVPAENQELILKAFEEDRWPFRIDDPLPPQSDQDPKRRLHDTIDRLNRNQLRRWIHFSGDGTGRGVCWDFSKRR